MRTHTVRQIAQFHGRSWGGPRSVTAYGQVDQAAPEPRRSMDLGIGTDCRPKKQSATTFEESEPIGEPIEPAPNVAACDLPRALKLFPASTYFLPYDGDCLCTNRTHNAWEHSLALETCDLYTVGSCRCDLPRITKP